ncbi:MAG: Holliday junction resolvase RuvX [Candidatus Limiplasma sp.]|nr:Holliday junction resolvase RuvX [Clostridiales bacterium]MDY3243096.1 Holliday junction resolvase RuvX [Candidatus Limiplasma sp.]MDY4061301.1 Holliday junction resolvase RuvX [Candidatus Limiplasma sp.]
MGRVIALDVGDVRIGVAVTDPTGTIAQPLEVYRRVGYGPDCRYVQELCRRFDTTVVLLGLPLNMDGTRGGQAEKAQAFGKVLSDAGLDVRYQDERMTTVTAERVLISGSVRREDRKQCVDKLAAAVILEQWLASQSGAAERGMNHGE